MVLIAADAAVAARCRFASEVLPFYDAMLDTPFRLMVDATLDDMPLRGG